MPRSDRSASSKSREGGVNKVSVEIPSEIKYLKKISSNILNSLSAYSLDDDRLFDIKLCIDEAINNAIVHGNNSDSTLPVKVSYWVENGSVNIEVEDKGEGFDYKNIPDPTADDNIMKGYGRGVYLILRLMDVVEFNETGNRIRMSKRLR